MANKMISQMWGPVNPRDFAADVAAAVTDDATAAAAVDAVADTAIVASRPLTERMSGTNGDIYMDSGTFFGALSSSNAAVSANQLYLVPIWVSPEMYAAGNKLHSIGCWLQTGSGTARFGIVSNLTDGFLPEDTIADIGEVTFSTAVLAYSATAVADVVLPAPGVYYLAAVFSSTPTVGSYTPLSDAFGLISTSVAYRSCVRFAKTYGEITETGLSSESLTNLTTAAPRLMFRLKA